MSERMARLCHRLILVYLIVLVGCSELGSGSFFESWRQWAAGNGRPTVHPSSASAAREYHAAPAPDDESAVESDDSATPPAPPKGEAAAEALKASLKAQSAADAAKKASDQAAEASKEASQAAARAGNGSPASGTSIPSSDSAKPAPSGLVESSPGVILSSASDASGEQDRMRTVELVRGLDQSIAKIDPATLNPDSVQRRELAQKLVRSAQKALLQNDYLEASSLAKKASVMLAPLIGGAPKADSSQ